MTSLSTDAESREERDAIPLNEGQPSYGSFVPGVVEIMEKGQKLMKMKHSRRSEEGNFP